MKKMLMMLLISVTVSMAAINVGTGKASGNYYDMAKDIKDYCQPQLSEQLSILQSDGSLDNLQGLSNKKYSMGIIQADVLMNQAKTNPTIVNLNLIKIIADLHVEPVHLLVPIDYKPSGETGSLWQKYVSGAKEKPISLSSLKNQTVSSWGGSLVSAKSLSYFLHLNWSIRTIDESNAVSSNTPIILVGGQPYAPVEKLLASGKWRMLPIDYNSVAQTAQFYKKVSVSYKMQGKIQSIPTVGISALLVGKSFRNEAKNADAVNLGKCIKQNLADLADDSNTNPNWNSVYDESKKNQLMQWSYFDR